MNSDKYTETLEDWVLALMRVMQHHPKAWEDFQRLYPKSSKEMVLWRETHVVNLENEIKPNDKT